MHQEERNAVPEHEAVGDGRKPDLADFSRPPDDIIKH